MANKPIDYKKWNCYLCHVNTIEQFDLLNLRTQFSKCKVIRAISDVLGNGFTIYVNATDGVCKQCLNLVNNIDRLEVNLAILKKNLTSSILAAYQLNNENAVNVDTDNESLLIGKPDNGNCTKKVMHECKSCNFVSASKKKYTEHVTGGICSLETKKINSRNKTVYNCKKCYYSTKLKSSYVRHLSNHNKKINLKCLQCGRLQSSIHKLMGHVKDHKTFNCRHCGQSAVNYRNLKLHLAKCTKKQNSSLNRCNVCRIDFYNPIQFRKHRLEKHEQDVLEITNKNPKSDHPLSVIKDDVKKKIGTESLSQLLKSEKTENFFVEHVKEANVCAEIFVNNLQYKTEQQTADLTSTDKLLNDLLNFGEESDITEAISQDLKHDSMLESRDMNNQKMNDTSTKNDLDGIISDLVQTSATHAATSTLSCENNLEYIPISKSKDASMSQSKEHRTMYVCAICKYQTAIDAEMKDHISSHTKVEFKCELCQSSFKAPHALEQHKKRHVSAENKIMCNLCTELCIDKLHLKSHKNAVHNLQLKCSSCNEVFTNVKELEGHSRIHIPANAQYKCNECKKIFTKEVVFNRHQEYEHRLNNKCKFCPKQLPTSRALRIHEQRHKRELHRTLKCPHCEKILKTRTGLKVHIARHTGEYKFFCEVCGRGFMSRVVLNEHMGVHTREDRYVCDVCGKKFCFNATYRIHRLWHDNPKPYECSDCNARFSHTSLLAVHRRRIHTGERPYVCSECNISFTSSYSLKRHKHIHTGERPFVCRFCSKGFIERKVWAKHLANEHDDLTELKRKVVCEYKMVIKPETEEDNATVLDNTTLTDNNAEQMQEYIIISNPANIENMIFYDPAHLTEQLDSQIQTKDEPSDSQIKFTISEGYRIVPEGHPTTTFINNINTSNIFLKTDVGEMVLRNGNVFPLTAEFI